MSNPSNPYVSPTVKDAVEADTSRMILISELSVRGMCVVGSVFGFTLAAMAGISVYLLNLIVLLIEGRPLFDEFPLLANLVGLPLLILPICLIEAAVCAALGAIAYYPHRIVLRWIGGINARTLS